MKMSRQVARGIVTAVIAGAWSCGQLDHAEPMSAGPGARAFAPKGRPAPAGAPAEAKAAFGGALEADDVEELAMAAAPEAAEAEPGSGAGGPQARSWFPETFLFAPLVQTDAAGRATYRATVPDRLTTWRVLALAHSREGQQAGAVARFMGTLDVYCDPVVPAFLTAGDRVDLPVQVVNTTDQKIDAALVVAVSGGTLVSPARRRVTLRPRGSAVVFARVYAPTAGVLELRAALGQRDSVVRKISVRPAGRPVTQLSNGTLAAPRTLDLVAAKGADPASAQAQLKVFPGALAVLRSELASVSRRGGVANDAYALLLFGEGPRLIKDLGGEPDHDRLREMGLLASQRVLRHGRAPELATAVLLAQAALSHPDNPVLQRLGARMVQQIVQSQRPDGTFGGGQGWTLQRVLVTTAEAVRVARTDTSEDGKRRMESVNLRASFAFERHLGRVVDPYTAAAMLASGAVEASLQGELRRRVRSGVKANRDGTRTLDVPQGVVRPDGLRPSSAEATALAALALADDPEAPWRTDLAAGLIARYDPSRGWGDGVTSLACLRAVIELFSEPIPDRTEIQLALDGEVVATGVLETAKLRDTLVLEVSAAAARGAHRWTVSATPPLAGLGFSFALRTWVPWIPDRRPGLELKIDVAGPARVGRPVAVVTSAAAPARSRLIIEHALAAGVQVDDRSLQRLVQDRTITRYESEAGRLVLHSPPLKEGRPFSASYRLIPTLSGKLHTSASSVRVAGDERSIRYRAPTPWGVGPAVPLAATRGPGRPR